MFCYISKGVTQRLRKLPDGFIFCTTSNIYHYIPTYSQKTLTNYIPVFSGRITLSIGENCMKNPLSSFRVFREQTDRQTRRKTLFYNMYRWVCIDFTTNLLIGQKLTFNRIYSFYFKPAHYCVMILTIHWLISITILCRCCLRHTHMELPIGEKLSASV